MHDHADEVVGGTEPTRDAVEASGPEFPPAPFPIGRYEARRLIARHGQGLLFEGFDPQLERTVAIKVVTDRGGEALERCEREARALAHLQHPNIVPVFDLGRTRVGGAEAAYFVMEYLHGACPLTDFASRHGLELHERVRLGATICEAVAAGHEAGIVHRDLKPDNLLVDREGTPWVIDFGLASGPAVDDRDSMRAREQGAILGSLWYMSPQQFEGDPDLVDRRADVYALGVVLYELLTGALPYPVRGRQAGEVAAMVRGQAPTPPSRHDPRLRGDLGAVLLRALEKDVLRRYQSMRELSEDLRAWLRAAPVRARPGAAIGHTVRSAAFRAPRGALAACWVLSALAAFFVARPAFEHYTPLGNAFERAAARAGVLSPEPGTVSTVRSLVVSDETDVAALAVALGAEGVDPSDHFTFRALYGRLLQRLAPARPAVVAIDIAFEDKPDPGDAELADGIRVLSEAGCPVVLATPVWPPSPGDLPPLDRDILSGALWGGITGQFKASEPWRIDFAVQQPGQERAAPSLSLAVLAAFQRPRCEFTYSISREKAIVEIECWERTGGSPRPAGSSRVKAAFVRADRGTPHWGIPPASVIAHRVIEPPADEILAEATIDAGDVVGMSPEELQRELGGRVVLLAKPRGGKDLHPHADGRWIGGHYAQMVAIEGALNNILMPRRTVLQDVLSIAGGAGVGLFGAGAAFARFRRRAGLLLGAGVGMMLVSVIAFSQTGLVLDPVPAFAAMVLAAECSAGVAGVRRVRGFGLAGRPPGLGVGA